MGYTEGPTCTAAVAFGVTWPAEEALVVGTKVGVVEEETEVEVEVAVGAWLAC